MKSKVLIVLFLSLIVSACAHAPAGFTPSVSPMEKSNYNILGHATGTSSYFSIFGIFPTGNPDYNAAINDAIGSVKNGRTLINARAWTTSKFLIIGIRYILTVEGDVID